MKVSIEIPKRAIKKASYLLMSQTKEEDEEKVTEAVEALEKENDITISEELFDGEDDNIYLALAFSAIATKAKELEEKKDE